MHARSAPAKRTARRRGVRGPANAEALLAAAHRLVAERGDDFTTQDLVREADVALQTFYRHFGSKDQLLLAVIADLVAGHCRALAERASALDDPLERLHLYITETLRMTVGGVPSAARFMTAQHWRLHQEHSDGLAAAIQPFADLVQRELEQAAAAGSLAPREPARDAWLISKLVVAVFHHYAFAAEQPDAAAIAEEVWDFCLAAVGGPVPRA